MSKSKTEKTASKAKAELAESTPKDIVKKKRNWVPNPQKDFGQENVEPGDNSRFLRMARVAMDLPPIDISDPVQVEKRINEYFDFCEQNDSKPGMVGLANWLGVSHETLGRWKRGDYRSDTHCELIKKAVMTLEVLWEDYMQNGKINPASGIFLGKNMFGYRDVIDIAPAQPQPLGDEMSQKELEERIAADVVVEEDY